MKVDGKKAIVTGAAKGMGAAITTTLAREGADVVLTARETDALDRVAGDVRALGREAHVVACDVTDDAQVKAMVEIGTFLPIKYVVPTMIAQRSGKIVNIGGTSGLRGYAMRTAYSASKWAVRGITRTVALEVGKYNVNVNAVCPGIVETPRMQKLCEEKARVRGWTIDQVYDEYVQEMCLKRVTTPDDVANAVLFMASEDSRQITGQAITVDGGWDV